MAEQPTEEDVRRWHRTFAVDANNRAWALAEKAELAADELTELLYAAYASAHHWSKIGTEQNTSRAQLLLGRAHALLGQGALSMLYARAAFDSLMSRGGEPWEMAFAHAIMANAAFVSGDLPLHAQHYAQAKAVGESLLDEEDRSSFLATFHLIPSPDDVRK
jgi:hypothetical protein